MRDEIYRSPGELGQFQFDQKVSQVFDDMALRSIPFYKEGQRMAVELCQHHLPKAGKLIDLGCSTGSTLIEIALQCQKKDFALVGMDASKAMIERAKQKADAFNVGKHIHFKVQKIEDWKPQPLNAILLQYTLQFIARENRQAFLSKCHNALEPGGILLLCEKVDQSPIQRTQEKFYYDFKRRNGYSELEIAQKREALEKVLLPMTWNANLEMLQNAGFKKTELIFKWYNFAFFLGVKG